MFEIDDIAYIARPGQKSIRKPCPICNGDKQVTLILGTGEYYTVECEYCGKGYSGPRGYIEEYEWSEGIERVVIDGKETRQTREGTQIEYHINATNSTRNILNEDELFSTEEAAKQRSQTIIQDKEKEQNTRAENIKHNIRRSYTWNAGYHMKEAKRHQKQLEYHQEKARLCKERNKATGSVQC